MACGKKLPMDIIVVEVCQGQSQGCRELKEESTLKQMHKRKIVFSAIFINNLAVLAFANTSSNDILNISQVNIITLVVLNSERTNNKKLFSLLQIYARFAFFTNY